MTDEPVHMHMHMTCMKCWIECTHRNSIETLQDGRYLSNVKALNVT